MGSTKTLRTVNTQNTLDINYWGYGTSLGGYGIATFNSMKYLKRAGINVIPNSKFKPVKGTFEYQILTEEEKELLEIPWEEKRLGIINATPFDFHLVTNELKVAYTMCESDLIGDPWVQACNAMDYVFVPNQFNRIAFINSGVSQEKIRVVKQGIDTERFAFYQRPTRDVYTFGIVGYMNDRKGVFELIKAFCSEFNPWEEVRLYIKSSNKEFGFYSNFSDPRIVIDIRHLSNEDMLKVYKSFDCFVFPSKAEGVGMPPREAMSTGLPVIFTKYSGLEDLANPEVNFPLTPVRLVKGINPMTIEQPGNWAEIDIQELMYYMRWCFDHPEEAAEMGELGSEWIKEKESWEVATQDMIKNLKEVNGKR